MKTDPVVGAGTQLPALSSRGEPPVALASPSTVASRRSRVVDWSVAHAWALAVWVALVSWSGLLFAEFRSDYQGFRFGRFDLGNMVQTVWSTAHGRLLEQTLGSGEQAVRLASHVDPILALFAPFWLLWPSPLLLGAVQIAGCALGALPVFWLGRRHLGSEEAAGLLALAYLLYPWLPGRRSTPCTR